MKILGLFKGSTKKALKSKQTADVAQLNREFSEHPSRGLTPAKLASILEDAEHGDLLAQLDLFMDMEEKDAHIMAELGKRKRAVLGLDWMIVPPKNASAAEEKAAEQIKEIIESIPDFEDVLLAMADGIGYGFSCLEYEWVNHNELWVPAALHHRPHRWFTVDRENRESLRLRDNSENGQELWKAGWIVHEHKAKSGDLTRSGLFRTLAWPFLFKNYSVRDLAEFLEIYGLPVRVGQYPPGATDKEKATLLRAVVNMGHSAAGIIPESMMIDFKEAAKGGGDPFMAMIEWCEKSQSKAILGGTLTSQADGKSSTNALGNVHNEVRKDLLISDAKQIASTLTRDLVLTLCQINGIVTDPARCPRFEFDIIESEDLSLFAEAIPKLVDIGADIPIDYVHEKLKIPKPKEGQQILQRTGQQQPTALAALKAESARFTLDQQHIESLADESVNKSQSPIKTELIASAIRSSTSPEDLEQRLSAILEESDLSEFSHILERALFAADVMGYANTN